MWFWLTILFTLGMDQVSKYLLQLNMYRGESIPLIPPVFYLTYIENPGAAFGMMPYRKNFFIIITILVISVTFLYYRKIMQCSNIVRVGFGLVIGGAAGNLIDRIRIGRVIDFLDFRIWPVFNLADTAIVIGVSLLIISILFSSDLQERDGNQVIEVEDK